MQIHTTLYFTYDVLSPRVKSPVTIWISGYPFKKPNFNHWSELTNIEISQNIIFSTIFQIKCFQNRKKISLQIFLIIFDGFFDEFFAKFFGEFFDELFDKFWFFGRFFFDL